ncbi:hypothetical protein ACJJTC_001832, partial [Scirpophaga incertulas]
QTDSGQDPLCDVRGGGGGRVRGGRSRSVGGRGRGGRGRGGRGLACGSNADRSNPGGSARGHGEMSIDPPEVPEDALHLIRVQRQATQRRIAAMPIDVRRELVGRKRQAQLERMLLPDAPPRKRKSKRPSPERQACIMVDPTAGTSIGRQSAGSAEAAASTSGESFSVDHRIAGPAEAVPSTSGESFSVDHRIAGPAEAVASTSGNTFSSDHRYARPVEAVASTSGNSFSIDRRPVGCSPSIPLAGNEDDELGTSSADTVPNSPYSSPSVTDQSFEDVMADFFKLADMCDSDNDELDIDDDPCLLPLVSDHSAMAQPACSSDLTLFQAEVLQAEDEANDQALREIIPDDGDIYTFNWTNNRQTFVGRRESFTKTSGPTFLVTERTRPVDVFDKMFDEEFIDRLCTETNRYAIQKLALLREQNKLSSKSRFSRWTPTDRDEMVSFLAVQILQGLYPLVEEESYFCFNGFGTLQYFGKIMSYNRFLLLKTMLHFVDNQTLQDTTRLCKIRPVVDYFNHKFSSLYMPSQEIAIDESLLKWHGRLNFAQKISSKAAQVGVKTYELCESSSGYLWKFFVYAGKDKPTTSTTDNNDGRENDETPDRTDGNEAIDRLDDDNTNDRPDNDGIDRPATGGTDRPTNATAKIVYDLIEPLLHRGHTLIMDNFYNSPLLLRSLKRQKTDCYGTLRLNREFVPESVKTMTKTELRQGEVVATYCSDLSVMVWRDANIVSMISTYHNLQIGTNDKYNRATYKPSIVLDYNKTMGGIDRKDKFLSAQPMERLRNRVWYKKLFRRMCNSAIFNCYVIFSSVFRKISHRQFRTTLAEDLLKRHRQIDLTTEPRVLNVRTKVTGQVTKTAKRVHSAHIRPMVEANHFPIRTGSKSTVCYLCKKSRTIWKCEECNINLCIEICFKAYHKP